MADEGLDHSRETRHLLNNHIQVTGLKLETMEREGKLRHQAVVDVIARLESALKWAGGIIVSLTLTVLGWALLQQINANEAQKKDMQQQLDLLRAQAAQQLRTDPAADDRAKN
jgi:hypothetical protein